MEVFQAKYLPSQEEPKPEHLFAGMTTKVLVSSWPPVGQVTESSNERVQFTVLLETDEEGASTNWDVAIWYLSGDEWKEAPLSATTAGVKGNFTEVQGKHHHSYFAGSLEITSTVTFTIKFRKSPEEPWKWIKDHQGAPDGVVLLKNPTVAIETVDDLGDLIEGLNPEFKIEKVRSQSPNTSVWNVEAPVAAAEGDESTLSSTKFGKPWSGDILRYGFYSLYRTVLLVSRSRWFMCHLYESMRACSPIALQKLTAPYLYLTISRIYLSS